MPKKIDASTWLKKAVEANLNYLLTEILADNISWGKSPESIEVKCGNITCFIDIERSTP